MQTITPVISIILSVYNGGRYLLPSIQSVLCQDLPDFELLIIDDCSSDDSRQYVESISDRRIKYFRNEVNKGLFYNLNFLIRKSQSPLIKLWSQDDIMYPRCLRDFVKFHSENPGIGFSYCQRDIIDEKGELKKDIPMDKTPSLISTELHAQIAYYTGSVAGNISNVCISRNAYDHTGPFNESMKISADFDMWVRLAQNYNTGHINDRLVQLRDHKGQLSRKESWYIHHVKEDLKVYRYLNSYVTPELKRKGKLILRANKLPFYYTLMLKAMLKGKFRLSFLFYNELVKFDNFFMITKGFILNKFSNKKVKRG